jgi:hypothetical protein
VVAAALSGWLRGTVLSISVLSVTAGLVLAWTGIIDVSPWAKSVVVVELARARAVRRRPRRRARAAARALDAGRARPRGGDAGHARAARARGKALFPSLSWAEAFLLGAVLSPTDPVVTSAVVTAKRIPPTIRNTLNLESGLNDGLALPFVLFFLPSPRAPTARASRPRASPARRWPERRSASRSPSWAAGS